MAGVQQLYDTSALFDKNGGIETYAYFWSAKTKFGYVSSNWTLAGLLSFGHLNDDIDSLLKNYLPNGVNFDYTLIEFGLEGQYILNNDWNLVAGISYETDIDGDKDLYGDDVMNFNFGINYNIDATKFVGLSTTYDLNYNKDNHADESQEWELEAKFGIDF